MTHAQLHRAVAAATGESLCTIRQRGFGMPAALEPEDVELVLDCPFCGKPVPYPGTISQGLRPEAECQTCGVAFEFEDDEVYPAPAVVREPALVA
jgi:hypothetical protein